MADVQKLELEPSPPKSVSDYQFVDENDKLVSFAALPIRLINYDDQRSESDKTLNVFLIGSPDSDSARRMHKHIVSWRFDLSTAEPEISVLSSDGVWIKLLKPKKRFEEIVRPILVTLQCLHFVMRNPEASHINLGRHIAKVLGLHEDRSFESDLSDHLSLIREAVGANENLAKSKFLQALLDKSPEKRELYNYKDFEAINTDSEASDGSEEDKDRNDTVCALCDEGGELLCCEGRCLRAFHATTNIADAITSRCQSLGFTEDEVDAMENFVCENCKYEQHQCFVCGQLGNSSESKGPEVFCCCSSACGHFYHPNCVAKLIHCDDSKVSVKDIERDISLGEPFMCHIHRCNFCKEFEDEKKPDLQFAICRRCPVSYHLKCLPWSISFVDNKNKGLVRRAWRDLLPNRVLMYCLKHKLNPKTGTAFKGHIKFPEVEKNLRIISRKRKFTMKRRCGNAKRQARDSKKIDSKAQSDALTKIRHRNSVSRTKQKSPSGEFKESSDHSLSICKETNNALSLASVLTFVDGPWDKYWHHPNGGWIEY